MELIKLIKDLWPHVYQKDVISNNEINLAFAKGIWVERKRWDVCWAQFANYNDILVENEVVLSSRKA